MSFKSKTNQITKINMKKILLFLIFWPILIFSQDYSNFSQSISLTDLVSNPTGGASGTISIADNVLTANFSGGWNASPMRTGVIKYLNIIPVISYLELGAMMNNAKTAQTGYFAKIENNNLIFYTNGTPPTITGCNLYFTKVYPKYVGKKVTFAYDSAGNQINRVLCLTCTSKKSDETTKEISAVTEEDLQKFFPEDVLSYYPNPVREELYLKWQLTDNNYIKALQIYNFNGQKIKSYSQSNSDNSLTIPFQSYPAGIYLIALEYSNGDQKTIKIIKK